MCCLRISHKLSSKAWLVGNDTIASNLIQLEKMLQQKYSASNITITGLKVGANKNPRFNVTLEGMFNGTLGGISSEVAKSGDDHLNILFSLANQNAFILDDRVQNSLSTVKECFKGSYHSVSSVLKFVEILHLMEDKEGLMEILPYFINDTPFMPGDVLSRLTRIYSINFRGSPILSNFYKSVVERIGSQPDLFSLDDRLSCILSSFEYINDSKVIFDALELYAANMSEDLVTNITVMRIYHRAIKSLNFTVIPNFTRNLMDVIQRCMQSDNVGGENRSVEKIVRYCRLLAHLCVTEEERGDLKKVLERSWGYISRRDTRMTVRDALYMLESMSPDMQTTISSILQYIAPQMSELSLDESMALLNSGIDSPNMERIGTVLESQFSFYSSNLDEQNICKILSFYSSSSIVKPSEFLINRICERILTIYYESPVNFANCVAYLNALGTYKPEIVNRFVKYVYNNVISMDPKEISISLYTLRKLRCSPQKLIDKVAPVIKGGIRNFKPIDLVYCIYFVSPHRGTHKGLFQALISAIQDKLELLVLDQLVMISTSLVSYKKQPFVTLMYSHVSAHVPFMNANQLCSVFSSFASTGLKNDDLMQRLNHYTLARTAESCKMMSEPCNMLNLLNVVRRGYANQRLIDYIRTCQVGSVYGFELFDIIPNIDDLSSSDVVSCVLVLGNKKRSKENDCFARELFTRLFTIAPVLSFDLLNQISASISSYGYSKPKINRIVTNLMSKKAPKLQNGGGSKHLFFRPIDKGPPHLKP